MTIVGHTYTYPHTPLLRGLDKNAITHSLQLIFAIDSPKIYFKTSKKLLLKGLIDAMKP